MSGKRIRVGGASGYWGESDMATPQLLAGGKLDYLVFDYLAEITMSIMARARAADPNKGYALDFVSAVLKPNLVEIAKQDVTVISNAGGVNPQACGAAIRELVKELGLDLKVAVITGDDVLARLKSGELGIPTEMFSGDAPPAADKLMSANAYLGAFPIAEALHQGADIVVTGRCVDSAVTLGACIHAFGWKADEWDKLSAGSLAGHVIECGPQATGGNFTDWRDVADTIAEIGYPIAEIAADGTFICTKPEGTGGIVSVGTVSEQIVYEIGDPQAYLLPDVVCDFADVSVTQEGPDRVRVIGAKGYPAPDTFKVSATFMDGFKGQMLITFTGFEAADKVKAFTNGALARARKKLHALNAPDFEEASLEILGTETQYGSASKIADGAREVVGKFAVKHVDQKAVGLLFKELMGLALATPAGLSGIGGGTPKPSPVVRLFSCTIPRTDVPASIDFDGVPQPTPNTPGQTFNPSSLTRPAEPAQKPDGTTVDVPLVKLAWGRSGDKGNKSNIGIVARSADYFPYIANALTSESVRARFAHFVEGDVERFVMPGMNALNFLMHDALGGGGIASLRNDSQGKAYAQILLDQPIPVPAKLAEELS
jgi:Acyclic terpene utilisation family protein AtuA